MFGETSVVLFGPEANERVMFDQEKLFSSEHGWGSILGLLFPRGLMLRDFDDHRIHRKTLGRFQSGTDAILSRRTRQGYCHLSPGGSGGRAK